jgi:hypothetical protein
MTDPFTPDLRALAQAALDAVRHADVCPQEDHVAAWADAFDASENLLAALRMAIGHDLYDQLRKRRIL